MKRMFTPSLLAIFIALALVFTWWSGVVRAADGGAVYSNKCLICHGPGGQGNGPGAALLKTKPQKFTDPSFWQGNVSQKIAQAVTNGKGEMVKVDLSPDEIKAVTAYITQRFKP
jgi:mono/diheme cytochrome c family protein